MNCCLRIHFARCLHLFTLGCIIALTRLRDTACPGSCGRLSTPDSLQGTESRRKLAFRYDRRRNQTHASITTWAKWGVPPAPSIVRLDARRTKRLRFRHLDTLSRREARTIALVGLLLAPQRIVYDSCALNATFNQAAVYSKARHYRVLRTSRRLGSGAC